MADLGKTKLHIAMYPWLAMGHITPFIHLANQLAIRGHSISILLPKKALLLLGHHNLHPDLITFHLITIPPVAGLPPGAETASDIDITENDPLATAFDSTAVQVETLLRNLRPDIVFYDFAFWMPRLGKIIGFKTVCYSVICAACLAIAFVPARGVPEERPMTAEELLQTPEGYPSTTVVLRGQEASSLAFINTNFGSTRFNLRLTAALSGCDAIGIRTCRELEGPMCDYLSEQYKKPVLLSGPTLPETANKLDEKWDNWLNKFEPRSVIYCAFGSQMILPKNQFQELVLAFEMTGLPFLVAVSKLLGWSESIEAALPEGFLERVGERGVVYGGWVQQTQILSHPSVGCFVSHCGFGSMWEALLSECQIVLVPWLVDQILSTRLLEEMEVTVAVAVARGDRGSFTKEDLCMTIRSVMDVESEVGKMVKKNHAKWRDIFSRVGFMDEYVDGFIQQLYQL